MDTTLGMIFLGLIALASLVQATFLVVLATASRRLAHRVDELQGRLEREIRPTLANLTHLSGNLAELSDLVAVQARRLDGVVSTTVERVDETAARVQAIVLRPLGLLGNLVPFLRAVQKAIEVYRRLGGLAVAQGRRGSSSRRYEGDEHLFI